jgi:hypothetical protein
MDETSLYYSTSSMPTEMGTGSTVDLITMYKDQYLNQYKDAMVNAFVIFILFAVFYLICVVHAGYMFHKAKSMFLRSRDNIALYSKELARLVLLVCSIIFGPVIYLIFLISYLAVPKPPVF